jgi:hypothetical protein
MPSVRVDVELSEEHYREFQQEAKRRGVTIESLVQQMTQALVLELEDEEREGTDHPISTV